MNPFIAPCRENRVWLNSAIGSLEQEAARSADTHLLKLDLTGFPGIHFYFKDESSHPTGSLKHRLARSLFLYALCNGRLQEGQSVIDASSGSTAISEAWFARLLGLKFTAVMPDSTTPRKISVLQSLGATCDLVPEGVDASEHARARAVAEGACYLDQFGLAERATDWRGNNNIAESILAQMQKENDPVPAWVVCGAGTGGTSATIGRYLRYRRLPTQLCLAEPIGGAFAQAWQTRSITETKPCHTLVEGIGRSHIEPGFMFDVVDKVIEVSDADSFAAAWLLEEILGRRYGGSSGTNLIACLQLAEAMRDRRETGSIVSLLCDRGERYEQTLFNRHWLEAHGIALDTALAKLRCRLEAAIV